MSRDFKYMSSGVVKVRVRLGEKKNSRENFRLCLIKTVVLLVSNVCNAIFSRKRYCLSKRKW